MNNQTIIQREVMRRVRFVYAVRAYTKPLFLKLYATVMLCVTVPFFVSVKDIIVNFSHIHVGDIFHFVTSAFTHTQLIVQIVCALILVFAVFLCRDLLRTRVPVLV